jgi:hypothetical protein
MSDRVTKVGCVVAAVAEDVCSAVRSAIGALVWVISFTSPGGQDELERIAQAVDDGVDLGRHRPRERPTRRASLMWWTPTSRYLDTISQAEQLRSVAARIVDRRPRFPLTRNSFDKHSVAAGYGRVSIRCRRHLSPHSVASLGHTPQRGNQPYRGAGGIAVSAQVSRARETPDIPPRGPRPE